MRFDKILLFGLAALVGFGLVFAFSFAVRNEQPVTAKVTGENKGGTLISDKKRVFETRSSGTMESGDVLIELTPRIISPERLIVKFAINTHSVDLGGFDLKQITTLDYGGKVVKPDDANSLSGHHAFGLMFFNIESPIEDFRIRIRGIPREEERVFEWTGN